MKPAKKKLVESNNSWKFGMLKWPIQIEYAIIYFYFFQSI